MTAIHPDEMCPFHTIFFTRFEVFVNRCDDLFYILSIDQGIND